MTQPDPYRPPYPGQSIGPPPPVAAHPGAFAPNGPQPAYPQTYPPQPAYPVAAVPQAYAAPVPAAPIPVSAAPAAAPARPRPVPVPAPGAAPVANSPRPMPIPANRPLPAGSRPVPVQGEAKSTIREETNEEPKDLEQIAIRSAPPWLVSLVVHLVAIVILALVVIAQRETKVIEIISEPVYAEKLGDQVLDATLQSPISMETDITDPALAIDTTQVNDPLAAPPIQLDLTLDASKATSDIEAPSIGLALSGREKGAKSALLAAYGGTATTEAAVREGLLWLKKNQRNDGSWSLQGPFSGGGLVENPGSATAMALLAFQGGGHTHKDGEFKDVVAKGWNAMLKWQDADGNFIKEGGFNDRLYAQAQCTIAVCEIYGMTKDEKFLQPAKKAIDFALRAQSPEGGWRYQPKIDSDTSVTGWFVMALQSARMAGITEPSGALEGVSRYLDSVANEDGTRYRYQRNRSETSVVMTAEAILCRQYLGWKHDDPRMKAGIEWVLANPVNYNDPNVYYWYYATQACHHMDGKEWDQWNAVMRQAVPTAQIKSGAEKGSWSPSDDRWGSHGGRLYTTCLSIYMLEVYYRHLPLYKQRIF